MRGVEDVGIEVIKDLRAHQPLLDELPDKRAVYESWPATATRYEVQAVIATVYNGSGHRGSGTRRTVRIQVSVVATDEWRDGRTNPTSDMNRILDECGERLDRACGIPGVVPAGGGGAGGSNELSGNRVFVSGDWRLTYTQIRH